MEVRERTVNLFLKEYERRENYGYIYNNRTGTYVDRRNVNDVTIPIFHFIGATAEYGTNQQSNIVSHYEESHNYRRYYSTSKLPEYAPEAGNEYTDIVLKIEFKDGVKREQKIIVYESEPQRGYNIEDYNALGDGDVLNTIAVGVLSRELSLTAAQLKKISANGMSLINTSDVDRYSNVDQVCTIDSVEITYKYRNRGTRGRISKIIPEDYTNIIANENFTITYKYESIVSDEPQGFLSVIAENQDTGEVVRLAYRSQVNVADGGQGTFTIPAFALSSGKWKITLYGHPAQTAQYYEDDDPYWLENGTSVQYTVRENSSASGVTCDGHPIPQVEWESVSQAAYQVKFGDYDSGARAGAETSFIVPRIFPDGAYPVQVRTANSAGIWSEWTELEYVTIRNVEPLMDLWVTATQSGVDIVVSWIGSGERPSKFAVFRDGKMIRVTGYGFSRFVDRIGAGGTYEVLGVTADRYYKSSGKVSARLNLAADLLSADGGYTWLAGKYTPDRKNQPEDVREDVSFVYYAGREKPIAYRTKQRSRTKSFTYVFKNRIPARTLKELVGSEVIVKTTRGEHIRGVIPEMSWGDARFVSPSFQIREIWGEEDGLEYPIE